MIIKAEFTAGVTEKRVSPLYQWDYGQTLEIESPDLSAIVEVHFACPEMKEAIVHACSVVNNVASVRIPDRCLEQSNTITAWVYEIEGTAGATTKVVYIPVVARTRPPRTQEIPEDVSDKYTELISEVNEAVGAITNGDIAVASAARATFADRATQADNASSAAYATSAATANTALNANHANEADRAGNASEAYHATYADSANSAQRATEADVAFVAEKDWEDNVIHEHYATFKADFTAWSSEAIPTGLYQFRVLLLSVNFYGVLPVDNNQNGVMLGTAANGGVDYMLEVGADNKPKVLSYIRDGSSATGYNLTSDVTIYYRKIN